MSVRMKAALERGGVRLIDADETEGPGVRLRKAPSGKSDCGKAFRR
jgi:hypothetical protein